MTDILIECKNAEKIVIYGAGTIANILYLYLNSNNMSWKVECFAVTVRGNNPKTKNGIKVHEIKNVSISEKGVLVLVAVQKILHREIIHTLVQNGCSNFYCVDEKSLLDEIYNIFYREPVQNNKILFSNMKGIGYGCNPKYIAQKLIELDYEKRLDMVWAVSDKKASFPKEIRTVAYGSMDYYHEMATARIWVDNVRKDSDIKKREGQYYIQTWHGAAPIKKVEKDVEDRLPNYYVANAMRDSKNVDLFLSGSVFYTNLYKRSCWYSGEIMQVGLPRQDIFFHLDNVIKEKVYRYYGIDKSYSMVLYAPTFRKNFSNEYYDLDIAGVVSALENKFCKRFVCAVSKHPENRSINYSFEHNEKYIAVDRYSDFQELLASADVLITDYSGCMYDYSFTKRPVFLYQRDYDDYIRDRNFYIPMGQLPYTRAYSNEEIIEKIKLFDMELYLEQLNQFMGMLGIYDDGNASEKVAKHILNVIEGSQKINN